MSALRTTRSVGATEFIMGSLLASVLFLGTACGSAPAPAGAPASSLPTQSATSEPTATPADNAALDTELVPDAGGADLAANSQPAFAAKAVAVLATLPIKGRAPKTGYSREEFGQAWADVDRNGCDTRNDILKRDLGAKTYKPGSGECVVLTGVLADPYTATTIDFVRGSATSSAVQIDHVVALNDAWQKGAQQLSVAQRTALANDPLNLLAADGPANQQKGASDASSWLPPNKSYRCDYVARQISVKATYSLWITQAEHDAMAKVLAGCAAVEVPTNQADPTAQKSVKPVILPPPAPVVPVAPVEAAPAPPAAVPPAPLVQAPGVFYQNCAAVRAAGAAPIRAGQPGYSKKLDRDGDGVACE
ncbi:GmrSD restriction endonuclease domain-containing protein [Arthrobacter sp. HLT1-20]